MAKGGSRGRRSYTRDARGRFASTPGSGPGKKPKRGALKASGGTLVARDRLRAARAKLTPGASRQQRAAVTRAMNRLKAAKAPVRMKTTTAGVKARIAKPKGLKRDPQAAAKLAALQQGRRGRQPNLRAQQAKAMANRTGVVPGRLRADEQDLRTKSLAEIRRDVRQRMREQGVDRRKFISFYAKWAGVNDKQGEGRMPKTRGDWEKIYRQHIGAPQTDFGRKRGPGVVDGREIYLGSNAYKLFKLNPKTATRADVEAAFRRVAKQVHPDVGGRRKDFEEVRSTRDMLLSQFPEKKPARRRKGGAGAAKPKTSKKGGGKGSKKGGKKTPRGPLLLPPAKGSAPAPAPAKSPRKPRRRKPKP